jgi:MFS family permease
VFAPVLLVVMRLLQGVSAGGEWGGAALMAVEHAPPGKRGAYGAFSQIGVPAGLILAQLAFVAVTASTTPEQFAAWGWRLPFLFSIVLVGIGLVVRLSLAESPVFAALRQEQARSGRPIVDVFRERPRELVLAALSFMANTAIGYTFLAYLLAYGTAVLKLSRGFMLGVYAVGAVVGGGFAPLIATALQTATGASWPVSAYMLVVGLISLAAVLALRETRA